MAYTADTRFVVTNPNRSQGEICFERADANAWRRYKRDSPERRWTNWPSEPRTFTDAEVTQQLAAFIDSPRIA